MEQPIKPRRSRGPRRVFVFLCVIAALTAAGFVWAYHYRNDEALGRLVSRLTAPLLRGRMHFGSIHWSPRLVVDLALGMPHRFVVRDFRVFDPQGTEVLRVARVHTGLDLFAVMTRQDLRFTGLVAEDARVLVAPLKRDGPGVREPGEVGLLAGFSGKDAGSPGRGPRLLFSDSTVKNTQVVVAFPDWSLRLQRARVHATVRHEGGEVSREGLAIDATITAPSGALKILEQSFPLRDFDLRRGRTDPHSMHVDLRLRAADSPLAVRGKLADLFAGHPVLDMRLATDDARGVLAELFGPAVGGAATLSLHARGALFTPRAEGRFDGVSVRGGGVQAEDVSGRLVLDAQRQLVAAREVRGRALSGHAEGSGEIDFEERNWRAALELKGIDPGALQPRLAGRLAGRVAVSGRLGEKQRAAVVLDLALERAARRDSLPARLSVEGTAHVAPPLVDLENVTVEGDSMTAVVRGSVNAVEQRANVHVRAFAPALGAWLARRGLARAAEAATASLHIRGRFPDLRATGDVAARRVGLGPLRMPALDAELSFSRGALALRGIRADAHGGQARGSATLELFAGDLLRPLHEPRLRAELQLRDVDLRTVVGGRGDLAGRVAGTVSLAGPLQRILGNGELAVEGLAVGDDRYSVARGRFGLLADRVTIYESTVRRAAGGSLRAWGDVFFDGRLALRAAATRFPLQAVPQLRAIPLGIAGEVDGKLTVGGTMQEPRPAGLLTVAHARLRGMDLGSGKVRLTPGSDTVRIGGQLFNRQVTVDGYMMMQPAPRLHLRADISRFPLHEVLPEMRVIGDVRALLGGQVQLDADAQRGLTWGSARFPTAEVVLRHRPPGSRNVRTVRVGNTEPLVARYTDGKLHVVSARLDTAVDARKLPGELSIGGWLSNTGSDLTVRGRLALEILEFFFSREVREISGQARANVHIQGPLDEVRLAGSLLLDRVAVKMPRFEPVIAIPRGRIEFTPGALRVVSLPVEVEGQRIVASGKILFDRISAATAQLQVAGDFNVRLLRLLLIEQLSHASGTARVRLAVDGPLHDPRVRGRVEVGRVEVVPRGTGRTLTLARGALAFNNYLIKTAAPLEGTYDEGRLSIGGRLRLDRWEPVDVAVDLTGVGLMARQPRVYLAEANVRLSLVGDATALSLTGDVDLIDARYVREFDIVKQALIRPRVHEDERAFWEGEPLLENLELMLAIRSAGLLTVKNRYGELGLDGSLAVTGTLAEPRLEGQVRAEEGKFRIPFLHGEYTLERGEIVFDRKQPIEMAQLDITAENRVERGDDEYLIKLQLRGPLKDVRLGLSSEPPLDPGQIAALLATGRTTDQLRSEMRGEVGVGGAAVGAADAQVKQLTGDLLGGVVEDQIRRVTRLDLFRLELGTETLGVRACKKFGHYLENCFWWEKGLVGDDQRAEVSGEAKLHDYLRLVGRAQRLTERIETEDENNTRLRLELKVRWNLR